MICYIGLRSRFCSIRCVTKSLQVSVCVRARDTAKFFPCCRIYIYISTHVRQLAVSTMANSEDAISLGIVEEQEETMSIDRPAAKPASPRVVPPNPSSPRYSSSTTASSQQEPSAGGRVRLLKTDVRRSLYPSLSGAPRSLLAVPPHLSRLKIPPPQFRQAVSRDPQSRQALVPGAPARPEVNAAAPVAPESVPVAQPYVTEPQRGGRAAPYPPRCYGAASLARRAGAVVSFGKDAEAGGP